MAKEQTAVRNIVLEFDSELAGMERLRGLVAERYFYAGLETSGQRIEFPAGMGLVVIRHEHYKQAGVGISWGRLADYVVKSGFVVGYSDSEIAISTSPPDSEVAYRPAPNERRGADGLRPPAWAGGISMRNTRPAP